MNRDLDGVSVLDVPAGELVITGHYHCPQTIGRVVYCGSPYETTFAEEGQQKGWLLWEDTERDLIPVRIAYSRLGAPRHHTIIWSPEQGEPQVPEGVEPGDCVRVRTNASRRVAIAASDQLRKAGLAGVPLLSAPDEGRGALTVGAGATPVDLAYQYVDRIASQTGHDPVQLKAFAEREALWR